MNFEFRQLHCKSTQIIIKNNYNNNNNYHYNITYDTNSWVFIYPEQSHRYKNCFSCRACYYYYPRNYQVRIYTWVESDKHGLMSCQIWFWNYPISGYCHLIFVCIFATLREVLLILFGCRWWWNKIISVVKCQNVCSFASLTRCKVSELERYSLGKSRQTLGGTVPEGRGLVCHTNNSMDYNNYYLFIQFVYTYMFILYLFIYVFAFYFFIHPFIHFSIYFLILSSCARILSVGKSPPVQ